MKKEDPQPKTQASGIRQPPRPPNRSAVGLAPEGGDPNKKYRATITNVAHGEGRFIRQAGGRRQYGHVMVKIEPNGRDKGVEIVSQVSDGAIPQKYIKPVTEGVRDALEAGAWVGHPIVDIVVRIVDGSFDETISSDLAFKMAGIFAIVEAMKKADTILIK